MDFGNPYVQMVADAATKYGVDPTLALGTANQESSFNPRARSKTGALGIMQLEPDTAKSLGVDPTDDAQNIDGGVRYLKQQLDTFGDPQLALAAYNAGPNRVHDFLQSGRALPAETMNYVQRISGSPLKAAFAQQQPQAQMPDNTYTQQPQPQQPDLTSRLFGGNPTPIGAVGNIARMLGIGSEPELGRRLQNAGNALIAVGLPAKMGSAGGAAALDEVANQPHYDVVSDALGNRYILDKRTGGISQPTAPVGMGGGQASGDPAVDTVSNSPLGAIDRAKAMTEQSTKDKAAYDDAATAAQNLKDLATRQIELSKDPQVVQGPGLMNMARDAIASASGGSVGNVNLARQHEFDTNNQQIVSLLGRSMLNNARIAGPEIKFLQMAHATSENPAETNQALYQQYIDSANRILHHAAEARNYNVLGPAFFQARDKYDSEHPLYTQGVAPQQGSGGASRPPLSSIFK